MYLKVYQGCNSAFAVCHLLRTDGSWTADSWSSGENGNEGGFDAGWNTEPQGNNKGSAYPDGNEEHGGDLETILGGVPGMDFPNFVTVPKTDFDCSSVSSRGYYGDVEAGCQVQNGSIRLTAFIRYAVGKYLVQLLLDI